MPKAIPDGYHSVTPSIMFKDSQKAMDFYKKAFNAQILDVFHNLNGPGIMHAVMKIGDSMIMMGDEICGPQMKSAETLGNTSVSFFVYVNDADAAFKQAVSAGCIVNMPMMDMFWGDRAGSLKDPFGNFWMVATHKEDLNKEQIRERAEKFFAQMAGKK